MEAFLRIVDRVEGLPEWLRPVAYGPLVIATLMMAKGVLILGPIVAIVALLQSDDPLGALATGGGVLGIVFGSSAAGGLVYSLAGRPMVRFLPFGWVPAGWIAVLPYFIGLVFVLRISGGVPLVEPLVSRDWWVVGIMTLIFGTQTGYMILRPGAWD